VPQGMPYSGMPMTTVINVNGVPQLVTLMSPYVLPSTLQPQMVGGQPNAQTPMQGTPPAAATTAGGNSGNGNGNGNGNGGGGGGGARALRVVRDSAAAVDAVLRGGSYAAELRTRQTATGALVLAATTN